MRRLLATARRWRPLKGWRVFAGEVGVVLLGVLLALGAQQLVEEYDRSQNRDFTRAALKEELLANALFAFERVAIEPCLKARLAQLDEKLLRPGPWRGDPQPLGTRGVAGTLAFSPVYRTPSRNWATNAWTTAVAADILPYMDRSRVALLGLTYAEIENIRAAQERESATAPVLTFLNHDQPLDPSARVTARTALARLDAENDLIVTIAHQLLDDIRAFDFDYPPAQVAALAGGIREVQRRYRGSCVRALTLTL